MPLSPPTLPDPLHPPCRLFLALWPGRAGRSAALACQSAWQWPTGARVSPASNLHVTLHFIGAVPVEQLPAIVSQLAVPAARMALTFDRLDVWPRGTAVLLPQGIPPALLALHARLQDALLRAGLPVEQRPWRPHVTLARRASGLAAQPLAVPVRWRCDGYGLALSAQGRYRVLQRYR